MGEIIYSYQVSKETYGPQFWWTKSCGMSADDHNTVAGAWVYSKSNFFIVPKKQPHNNMSSVNKKLSVWYISVTKGMVLYSSSLDFSHFL